MEHDHVSFQTFYLAIDSGKSYKLLKYVSFDELKTYSK